MEIPRTASVVVIGGGAVGCSIAYHLACPRCGGRLASCDPAIIHTSP